MSGSRLLISIEVLDFLRRLGRREQQDLIRRCRDIAAFPSDFFDFVEHDSTGRRLEVHVFGKFAIKFWDDAADGHVKILDLHFADGPSLSSDSFLGAFNHRLGHARDSAITRFGVKESLRFLPKVVFGATAASENNFGLTSGTSSQGSRRFLRTEPGVDL